MRSGRREERNAKIVLFHFFSDKHIPTLKAVVSMKMKFSGKLVELENIVHSEVNQIQKDKYPEFSLTCGSSYITLDVIICPRKARKV